MSWFALSWHCVMNSHVSRGTNKHAVPLSTTACQASTSGPHGTGACEGLLNVGCRVVRSTHSPSTMSQPLICTQKLCDTREQLTPESTTSCHFCISSKDRISMRFSTFSLTSSHSTHVSLIAFRSASRPSTRFCNVEI